ncbi:MAG: Fic family protein [Nitrospirae bacterium]|nr:Fic family protein [Nitrospirota bacterium]
MFEELDELKAHLDSLRPLDPDRLAAVKEKLRIDWTYNSNAIEGNTFTLQETVFVLREGLTVKGKPLSEYLEVIGHAEAIDWLEEVVREKRPLTERLIKDFHAIIMRGSTSITIGPPGNRVTKRVEPGCYKYDNNHVLKMDGTIHYYIDHLQVPGEMEALIKWYNESRETMHPIELAARLHHRLVAIHPFTDGNGRVSRIVMNMVLMQAGFFPAIIMIEDRREYLDALDAADAGDYGPFVAMVEREAYRTMKLVVDVVEGREAFGKEDLKRMVRGFAERVGKLDKDIGVISKDVDEHVRINNIEHVLGYIESIATDISREASNNDLHFIVSRERNNAHIFYYTDYCDTHQVRSVWWKRNDRFDIGHFDDKSINGCAVVIELESNRAYIPPAEFAMGVIPAKYKCIVVAFWKVPTFSNYTNIARSSDYNERAIDIGNVWGDYDVQILEYFFVETFKTFLHDIDKEIEERRRTISEQTNG